jgi:endonuclease-8
VPEGDTVWRTAQRLDAALAGRPVVEADLRWPEISTADLRGRTTLEVRSRGKHLLHRLEGGLTLHSHLRMEGQWRVEATPTLADGWRRNPQLRALVSAPDWTALGLRLGMLDLVATDREAELVGHLGPDVLGPDWDRGRAVANVVASGLRVGAALLDQRNLAGVGTMWCAEALFLERVHPWAPSADLGLGTVERVVDRAQRLVDVGRRHAVQSSTGSYRRDEEHYVHGRSGRPCRRCGATVRVAPIGDRGRERTMFYCPACQGGLAPTDDGGRQTPLGSRGGARRPRRST